MERDATSKHMKAGLAQVMQISRTKSPPEIKEDSFFLILKNDVISLYIYLCGGTVPGLCRCASFSLVSASQGYSLIVVHGLLSLRRLPLCGAQPLGHVRSSSCARGLSSFDSWAESPRLHSYGTRPQLLHGMWNLPRSGIKPGSPTLVGGFYIIEPPGKPK